MAAKEHNLNDPLAGALQWDYGTAYEFLLSMDTLFRPKVHGLAAPWAAGVRKRLSAQSQAVLKGFYAVPFSMYNYMPLHLVLEMPAPKDAAHLLEYIEAIPGEEFMRRFLGERRDAPCAEGVSRRPDLDDSVTEPSLH